MRQLLLVCLAGAVGSGLRWLVVVLAQRRLGDTFPWGVLGVNVVGSFLIALVVVLATTRSSLTPEVRTTLTAGFLGGLTTYSSFNQDTLAMLDGRLYGRAATYVLVTLAACLLAGACGTLVARRL
jgi:CrcB protein